MHEQELRITSPAEAGAAVPRLELCGPWLEQAGFRAGCRVEVEVVEPGRLVPQTPARTRQVQAPVNGAGIVADPGRL